MTWELIFAPEVEAEIADAQGWYDEQSPGLGAEFITALNVRLAAITENPFQYQIVWKHFRRVGLGRFPYNLFYSASDDFIRVVGCVHGRRNPAVWQERT